MDFILDLMPYFASPWQNTHYFSPLTIQSQSEFWEIETTESISLVKPSRKFLRKVSSFGFWEWGVCGGVNKDSRASRTTCLLYGRNTSMAWFFHIVTNYHLLFLWVFFFFFGCWICYFCEFNHFGVLSVHLKKNIILIKDLNQGMTLQT